MAISPALCTRVRCCAGILSESAGGRRLCRPGHPPTPAGQRRQRVAGLPARNGGAPRRAGSQQTSGARPRAVPGAVSGAPRILRIGGRAHSRRGGGRRNRGRGSPGPPNATMIATTRVGRARPLRKHALSIFRAALAAADPAAAVTRHLERLDSSRFKNIYVVGAGKAAASMARAAERALGSRIAAGYVNVKDGHGAKLRRIEQIECGHPEPDERGVAGARRIAEIAGAARKDDLVLCLISGGASALMPLPAEPITLEEKREVTRLLLACGADIHEINTVRKHISSIKGGQLARLAAPATVESLLLSDVVGDPLDVIGSGPTAPDASTFADASGILYRYGLMDRVPESVSERIDRKST